MKQDIKILERMLKIEKECLHYDVSQDEIRALEHLLKVYKELEEEKEALVETVSQLIKENSELKDIIREHTLLISPYYVAQNYIPVSLVEEKIEEIDKIYKGIPEDEGNFAKAILIKEKQVLQELLEKRK